MQKDRKTGTSGKGNITPFEIWDRCTAAERSEIAVRAVDNRCVENAEDKIKKAVEFSRMDSHSLREKYPCAWRGIFRYILRVGLKTRRR